jgi:putative transposase
MPLRHSTQDYPQLCRGRCVFSLVLGRVLKHLHRAPDAILTCVRGYMAYPLSLRRLEDMMAKRGVSVDHSTVRGWGIKLLPVLEKAFRRRKRPVGKRWRMDETH